jgi:hypothetical protein
MLPLLADSAAAARLITFLEWIGIDRSQISKDGNLQLEMVNMPGSGGSVAVLLLILAFGLMVVWISRRTVDAWTPLAKVLLIVVSVAVYCTIAFALLGIKAVMFAGIFGAAFWVPWLYRWEIDHCSQRARFGLAITRMAVLAVLALIWLSPEIVPEITKTVQRTLLLVRDKSQSMDFSDAYRNDDQAKSTAAAMGISTDDLREKKPTRAKVLDKVLGNQDYKFLRDLEQRGKLLVIDFDDVLAKPIDPLVPLAEKSSTAVTPVSNPADKSLRAIKLPPLVADGRGSDIHLAIREPLSARSPAAMILFTDGQHTGKEDPREAAREALAQNVKLYIVGVGDPSRPKNLRIDSVYVQPNIWKKDEFGVEVALSIQGIDPQSVPLELIEQKVNESDGSLGPEKVVQRETLLLDSTRLTKTLKTSQTDSGKYVYSARVVPFDDESNADDNRASASPTTVRDKENLKVLLVAGAPTWEYRLVQKLLARDETIQLSCWLQTLDEQRAQDGDPEARIKELPRELTATRDVPGLNDYGVVLLFDPNPMEFDQAWIATLKKYVSEHSGGVLYMAGPKYTGSFLSSSRTKDIRQVIPVQFGDVGAVEVMTLMSTNNRAYPLRVVVSNSDHDMLRFYDDRQQSQQRWESLPGIFWSFPALGPKPTAQVLLEHSDTTLRTTEGARPLLVTGRYGAGNTAYIGFNGTWRWRQMGREAEFFDQFWIKTVRYLADARSSKGRRYGSLETDKDRYEVGDKVSVTARLRDSSYEPLEAPLVEATLRTEDGAPISITLKPVMAQKGTYEGFTNARRTGVHTLSVDIPSAEGVKPTVDDKNFSVELPRVEMNQQWLNKPLLVDLARMTGGEYFELNELEKLASVVPDQTEKIVERGPPTSLWDLRLWELPKLGHLTIRQLLLGMLVALLSVEWAARKALKLM